MKTYTNEDIVTINIRMKELLDQTAILLSNCEVSSGVCCCGSAMDAHGLGCGHGPVDQGEHYASLLLESIREILEG